MISPADFGTVCMGSLCSSKAAMAKGGAAPISTFNESEKTGARTARSAAKNKQYTYNKCSYLTIPKHQSSVYNILLPLTFYKLENGVLQIFSTRRFCKNM